MASLSNTGSPDSASRLLAVAARMCPGTMTILYACGVHFYQAFGLFAAGSSAAGNVSVDALMRACPRLPFMSQTASVACYCLLVAALALLALHAKPLNYRVVALLLLPQQILLFMVFFVEFAVLWHGQYADGYIPKGGSWFISTDQIWAILAAPWYTAAIFIRALRHEHSIYWRG